MAHDPARTEKATPKRREKARSEGTVLRIPDLDATVLLWGNFFLFLGAWSMTFTLLAQQVAFYLRKAGGTHLQEEGLGQLAVELLFMLLRVLAPFLAVNFLVALANQVVQHGLKFSFQAVQPKFSKLNPLPGFKKLVGARAFMEILKSLLKFLVLAWVAWNVLGDRIPVFMSTLKMPLHQSLAYLQETLFVMYRNILIAMLAVTVLDFLYQRREFEKNLRMTKQEVKDEAKDAEGSPEIKGKQKGIMLQAAIRRITTQVPKASVVITNPTHFAVALRYDEETAAPVCVAKGVDHLAFRIRDLAKEHKVVLVENPALARALYWNVDLEKPIPPELYQAVAQVLAYVYRLKTAA